MFFGLLPLFARICLTDMPEDIPLAAEMYDADCYQRASFMSLRRNNLEPCRRASRGDA
jgi:hypothetical protein